MPGRRWILAGASIALVLVAVPAPRAAGSGEDWYTLFTAPGGNLFGVSFVDAWTGFVGTSEGSIYRSTDGGRTWGLVHSTGAPNVYARPRFPVDTLTGYCSNQAGTVAKTTDGGGTWADTVVTASHSLHGLQFPAGTEIGWLCGSDGAMFKTNNGGTTWVQQATPASGSGNSLIGLSFPVDATTGWAAGGGGTILKRTGQHMVCGTYTGNGVDGRQITGLGFQPDLVFIKGNTTEPLVARSSTMAGDLTKVLIDNNAAVADRIQSLDAGGFSLGADADVNGNGTTYHYVAFKAEAGDMAVGTYVGDGLDDRNVAGGFGFTPGYVIIWGAHRAWQKFSTMTTESARFDANAAANNRIQAFAAGGFQVGDQGSTVNDAGVTYHYAAWNATAGRMWVTSWDGDGADGRTFAGAGFRPEAVLVKSAAGYAAVLRPESASGDSCTYATATAHAANLVQDIDDDGFEVGTANQVNRGTGTPEYHAVCWGGKWTAQAAPGGGNLLAMQMLDEQTGYIAGNGGIVLKTTNGGTNWADTFTVSVTNLCTPSFPLDATTGWVSGYNGEIYKTTDGGANWALETTSTTKVLWGIHMLDEVTGWAVGNDYAIVRPRLPRMIGGRYSGDGADGRQIAGLGFQPDVVIVQGYGEEPVVRTSTMVGDASRVIDGAGPFSLASNLVQSLDADGFTIGTDDKVNAGSGRYFWHAMRADAEIAVGSYVGTGLDHSITGLGFEPGFLMVMGSGDTEAVFRFQDMAGDASFEMGGSAAAANRIQAFESDGFEVGSNTRVNQLGTTYHYVAMKPVAAQLRMGSYTGDGSANRAISGLGFRPEWVVIKGETAQPGVHKMGSVGVMRDASFQFGAATSSDCIKELDSDGFTVGASDSANDSGVTYHWMAMARNTLEQTQRRPAVLSSAEKAPH